MLLSQSKFADMAGVSRQYINTLVKEGKLHLRNKQVNTEDREAMQILQGKEIVNPGAELMRGDLELEKLKQQTISLELKNARDMKLLVSKKLVEQLISIVDTALNRILNDGRSNLVPQLHTKIKGGCSVEEAQLFYMRESSKYTKPAKKNMIRAMKREEKE